jgi:hypothetical protein
MNILNTKEEALANAAKNNSSEQVSLVWPSHKEIQNPLDEPKYGQSKHEVEKVRTVAECGSSLVMGTEIYLALIEREWKGVEERVMRRMEVMVRKRMENAMEMTRENSEKEQRMWDCRQCRARCEQCSARTKESLQTLIGNFILALFTNVFCKKSYVLKQLGIQSITFSLQKV